MAGYRWWFFLLDRITVRMREVRGKGHFTELCRSHWAPWEVILSPDNLVPIISGTSFRDSKRQWVPTFPFAVVYWGLLYASALLGDSRVSPWAPKMTQSPWKDCSQLDILIYSVTFLERRELPSKDVSVFTSGTTQKEIGSGRCHQCEYASPVLSVVLRKF